MPMSPSPRRAWAEIDLRVIKENVRLLRAELEPQAKLLAVVKADAYGHGAIETSRAVLEAGAQWLGVSTVMEGMELREAGIVAPILLLCSAAPDEIAEATRHRLTPMLGDPESLRLYARASEAFAIPQEERHIHLEIDTGIGRAGVLPDQALDFWREAQRLGMRVSGLCSHFPDADADDLNITLAQQNALFLAQAQFATHGVSFDWVHLSNSAATLRLERRSENLARPGRLIYGILPPNADRHVTGKRILPPLRPALTLKARIAVIRELPEGHTISYAGTHRLARPSRVATALIGYGDGYPRSLSNIGSVLLHGERAPIIGRICMDQMVVDVTDIPQAAAGDAIICIGQDGSNCILAVDIAQRIGTTEHAITTRLTGRIPRLFCS